jgi:hypothetical protein
MLRCSSGAGFDFDISLARHDAIEAFTRGAREVAVTR